MLPHKQIGIISLEQHFFQDKLILLSNHMWHILVMFKQAGQSSWKGADIL